VSHATNLGEGIMEGFKFGMFELFVIEAEEVIHDNVAYLFLYVNSQT
jgi:hypothetical protein